MTEKEFKVFKRLTDLVDDIDRTLFHYNISVLGYHLNDEDEPIMNFYADFDMNAFQQAKELLKKYKNENKGTE